VATALFFITVYERNLHNLLETTFDDAFFHRLPLFLQSNVPKLLA